MRSSTQQNFNNYSVSHHSMCSGEWSSCRDCSNKIVRIIGFMNALCIWPWNKWLKVFTYTMGQ